MRIVHLLGGLRAYDTYDDVVKVGVNGLSFPMSFPQPAYPALYSTLESLDFRPIGVEFISSPLEMNGSIPRKWASWSTPKGLDIIHRKQKWSSIRFAEADRAAVKFEIAGKIGTYLRLTDLRLKQLSNAYHQTLFAKLRREEGDPLPSPGLFGNQWMSEIEAAIHAFFSDAAAFRDVIAEGVWQRLVQDQTKVVSKMGALHKHAKEGIHPLVDEILSACDDGGWIKNLTDLRNGIIHDAPIDRSHEHSFCDLRALPHNGGMTFFTVHYPLTKEDWSRRDYKRSVPPSRDQSSMRKSMEDYHEFVATSGDALEYAWLTLSNLSDLAERFRLAADLDADYPSISPIPGTLKRL